MFIKLGLSSDRVDMANFPNTYLRLALFLLKRPGLIVFAIRSWVFMNRGTFADEYLRNLRRVPSNHNSPPEDRLLEIYSKRDCIEFLSTIHPKQPKCLVKALLLADWLEKNSISYALKIGWRKNGSAHAWIGLNGIALYGDADWQKDCIELQKLNRVTLRKKQTTDLFKIG